MRSNLKPQKKNCSTIRPLLSISRFETGKFCDFWELPIYPDLSNKKVHFLRNRVRKQLLPTLKLFFNSRIEAVLLQFAEIIEAEDHYMNQTTKKLLKKLILAKIETKKLLSTLPFHFDNCFYRVMQTQKIANILTNTSLHYHFSSQGSLAQKFVTIRCYSKKCPGDLKPLQPIDFSPYITGYTPTYTFGVTKATPQATSGSAITPPGACVAEQDLRVTPKGVRSAHGVGPWLVSDQEITWLSITPTCFTLKMFTPEGGKQVNRHLSTLSYPYRVDLRCTIFDQFVKIIYQICESSKLGYVGTKGQFYWGSFSGCRQSMGGIRNKFKENQKLLGWKIHNPPQNNSCQFCSSCKKTPAFLKSAGLCTAGYASKIQLLPPRGLAQLSKPKGFYAMLKRRGVSKPVSTRSFIFLPSEQCQQNFFLLLKYKKKIKATTLQSTTLQSSIPSKFLNKFKYSGEIIGCNPLFIDPTYRVSRGSKESDKKYLSVLPPSFPNPIFKISHKDNNSDDFLSLALYDHVSLGDISTPTYTFGFTRATSGSAITLSGGEQALAASQALRGSAHGAKEKVSVPVINFVENLVNNIENSRKHESQWTLTSDGSSASPYTEGVNQKGVPASPLNQEPIEYIKNCKRCQVFIPKDNGKAGIATKVTSLKIKTTSLVGSQDISDQRGWLEEETECAFTPKMLATYRNINGDVLHSLFLFPRFSVPLGISLWMWNRRFGKSNPWSKNSITGGECALLGTSVKTKSMILSHDNTEWKFSLDPRLTLQLGSYRGLQKKSMKNGRNDIEVTFGSSLFLQTVSGLNVLHNQKRRNIVTHNLFLRFHNLEKKKKDIYWPIVISFFPIAVQRRVVKLFLINQNWKKIRYSQIDNFLEIKKKTLSTFL